MAKIQIQSMSEDQFNQMADQWERETAAHSSFLHMSRHPAYQKIERAGEGMLPFILRRMQTKPGHWFSLLFRLTRHNPIPEEMYGKIPEMNNAWVQWGQQNKIIQS